MRSADESWEMSRVMWLCAVSTADGFIEHVSKDGRPLECFVEMCPWTLLLVSRSPKKTRGVSLKTHCCFLCISMYFETMRNRWVLSVQRKCHTCCGRRFLFGARST